MDGEAVRSLAQHVIRPMESRPKLVRVDQDTTVEDSTPPAPYKDWDYWVGCSEWDYGDLSAAPPAGMFRVFTTDDLFAVRAQFIKCGRVPRARFTDLNSITSMTYTFSKKESPEKKKCVIRVIPLTSLFLQEASEKLHMDYRLESLGAWAVRAFRLALQGRREPITASEKRDILQRQNNQCLTCSEPFDEKSTPEFHHETPVAASITRVIMKALCGPCHAEITAMQGRHKATAESHLSDQLWTTLVDGPPPLALVTRVNKDRGKECCYVDRRRSRQTILLESKYSWPVFLPHDEIQVFDGVFGDFVYIVHKAESAQQIVDDAPLRGTGWYHRSVAEMAYEVGVLRPSMITHIVKASVHLKPSTFAEAYEKVMNALPLDEVEVDYKKFQNLRREAAHHLIGMWGRRRFEILESTTSQTSQDEQVFGPGVTFRQSAGVDGWYDFFHSTPTSRRHTYYLLYRKIIDEESALLTRLMRSLKIKKVLQLNTDSILYEGELPALDDNIRMEKTTEHRLKGSYKLPVRDDPPPQLSEPWRVLTETEAEAHVLAGGSLLIEALAGCGKSTFLRKVTTKLREMGKKVQMTALTHVAVANLEDDSAMTVSRWLYTYGHGIKNNIDVLVLDELSFVCPFLYTHLATILNHSKCQCIWAGDFFQLPPVGNVYLGDFIGSMKDRTFLKERCGGTRLLLTEGRRNDARLFDFYAGLTRADISLDMAVIRAKQAFPAIPGDSPINLVSSHKRRVALNYHLQEIFKPVNAIFVKPSREGCARKNVPQDMWLWPGLKVICAVRCNKLKNQWSYEIVELSQTHAKLRAVGRNTTIEIKPLSKVADWFRLPWARTYHSAQSLGFDRVRLWDTESTYFTMPHLITGMSRCTNSAALDFGCY